MIRRLLILAVAVAAASGCRSVAGPREARGKPTPVPGTPIEEQQRKARDKYALPSDEPLLDPPGYIGRGGPTGRTGYN